MNGTVKAPMQSPRRTNGIASALQVQTSFDYAQFKVMDGNRSLNIMHLGRLKASIEEKYLISPIIVNERWEVIDGQHRLRVCTELKLPVYFIMIEGYGLEEVQRLNVNLKNWTMDDFMHGYIELGKKEYAFYRDFKAKYGFSHADCLNLLCGDSRKWVGEIEQNNVKMFQNGKLKLRDYAQACEYADKVMLTAPYYKGFRRRGYIRALVKLVQVKGFDIKEFVNKLKWQQDRFYDCNTVEAYIDLIQDVYNYRRRIEDKVSFIK